jgi:hypothetical protein
MELVRLLNIDTPSGNGNNNRRSTAPITKRTMQDRSWNNKSSKVSVVTYVKEEKTGLEKDLQTICLALNKMAGQNYDTQKKVIFDIVSQYAEDSVAIQKIAELIFDISSSNKFLSELNARLYRELVNAFPSFSLVVNQFIAKYGDNIDTIEPEGLETSIKLSDKRKATTVFFVHLVKEGLISEEMIFQWIGSILDNIEESAEKVGEIYRLEELSEILKLWVKPLYSQLSSYDEEQGENMYSRMSMLSELKVGMKPSMSSRAIFMFRELLDAI